MILFTWDSSLPYSHGQDLPILLLRCAQQPCFVPSVKNTEQPVDFEFQMNNKCFFSISVSQIPHGTYTGEVCCSPEIHVSLRLWTPWSDVFCMCVSGPAALPKPALPPGPGFILPPLSPPRPSQQQITGLPPPWPETQPSLP